MAPTRATMPKNPACTPMARAPLLLGEVEVLEDVAGGLRSVLVAVPVEVEGDEGTVKVDEPEPEVTVTMVEELLPVSALIVKSLDWAKMVLRFWLSLTRLIWKPVPVGHPPLGAFTEVLPKLETT